MRQIYRALALLLIVNGWLQATEQKWVLLPPSQANAVNGFCSRAGAKVDRGWQLTSKDAGAIEDALSKDKYLRGQLTSAPAKDKIRDSITGSTWAWLLLEEN